MLVYYAITPNSVFKSLPPNGSEPTSQRSMLYSDIVPLIYVNETICMVICPSIRFKSMVSMARDKSSGAKIIPKYILWMTGLLPFWVLRLSFLSLTDCSVQFSSVPQSCLTLCDPMNRSMPGLPVHHQLLEFTQTHVHQLFAWGGQSTGVSALASFLLKKSQGWSPSEWIGCISLHSKGFSRVFSHTTVQKHQFFGAQPSSQSNSHIHTWPQEKP